jgi:hypothetical protein
MSFCKCEYGLWAEASAEASQVQALAKYSVIPNPSPVVHEGCRSGGRPPVRLITLTTSTDSTSAIHIVQQYFTLKKLYKNST